MASLVNISNRTTFFDPRRKFIEWSKENIVAVEGATQMAKLPLAGQRIAYEEYAQASLNINAEQQNIQLNYSGLGEQITFIAIKVTYTPADKLNITTKEPYLEYFFENEATILRQVNQLMILTGTSEKTIPNIFFNNPNSDYNARLDIMMGTVVITNDKLSSTIVDAGDLIAVDNLGWRNIISDNSGNAIYVKNSEGVILIAIDLSDISNIERNGRILLIDDKAQGKIQLTFNTEYDALQAYSVISWAIEGGGSNIINSSTQPDGTAPTITYTNEFTTEFNLEDWGTAGNYIITKQDLIDFLVLEVEDTYRDGFILLDDSNVSLTFVGSDLEKNAITEIGQYNLVFDVSDLAGNRTTESHVLNVKTSAEAKIILNTTGIDHYTEFNGTSGTNGIQNEIYLDDFTLDKLNKQDLIDQLIDSVVDTIDGSIALNTNNITVTIKQGVSTLSEITTTGKYDITFSVTNSQNNTTTKLWSNASTQLTPDNFVTIEILQNQPPVVTFNSTTELALNGGDYTKGELNTALGVSIVDDRDGIITSTVLNLTLYQNAILGTSGTSAFVYNSVLAGTTFDMSYISEVEKVSVTEEGKFKLTVYVVDSDGEATTESKEFYVIP